MWPKAIVVGLILALASVALATTDDYEPMVAFVCNMGAMHMDPDNGWSSDRLTDCMESKEDILDYCKKAYPSKDITNIVESSEVIAINGWCPLDKTDCKEPETYKVRPYRCLAGTFQSDALVVPRKCVFDHIHRGAQCQDYSFWADVAKNSCTGTHSMNIESYAMLLPCGTDMFTGVEFVCCPDGVKADESSEETGDLDTDNGLVAVPSIDVKVQAADDKPGKVKTGEEDIVQKYLLQAGKAEYESEHDAFTLAKKTLLKRNHDKITQLMKDWSEARNRIIEMKAADPKRAEQKNREITSRFQKEYFALQTSGDSKALQLDAVHQQHVQTNLNLKKRKTMEHLMTELEAEFYDAETILKYLQKYIAVEQKDAHHCIQHYLKIRDRDSLAAQQLMPATVEHLTLISTRINQSIDLLHQLDSEKVASTIESSIRAWVSKKYANIDKTIATFQLSVKQPSEEPKKIEAPAVPELKVVVKPAPVESNKEPSDVNSVGDGNGMDTNMYKIYADKLAKSNFGKEKLHRKDYIQMPPSPKFDEEDVKEDEHNYHKSPNYLSMGEMNAEASEINQQKSASTGLSSATAIAIAVGVVAALLVVILSVLVVKRKTQRRGHPPTNTYLEVAIESPDMSAEDKHIVSMQNGYENPTYKLLEHKKV